jgi:hypothetical protein
MVAGGESRIFVLCGGSLLASLPLLLSLLVDRASWSTDSAGPPSVWLLRLLDFYIHDHYPQNNGLNASVSWPGSPLPRF